MCYDWFGRILDQAPLACLATIWLVFLVLTDPASHENPPDDLPGESLIWEVAIIETTLVRLQQEPLLLTTGRVRGAWDANGTAQNPTLRGKKVRIQLMRNALAFLPDDHLASGQIIRFRGTVRMPLGFANPGSRDPRIFYRRNHWIGRVNISKGPVLCTGKESFFARLWLKIARLRSRLSQEISANLPMEQSALVTALLLGFEENISLESREAFVRSGVAHILAVSGLNIAILLFFTYGPTLFLIRRSRTLNARIRPEFLAFLLNLPILCGYLMLCGAPPSAVRAWAMIVLYLFGKALGRNLHVLNIFGFVALCSMVIDPAIIWRISWQLSFASVLAILLGAHLINFSSSEPGKRGCKEILLSYLFGIISMTLWATWGTLPLVVKHFGQLSSVGILSNLLVVPLTDFLILPMLFLSLFFYPYCPRIYEPLWALAGLGLEKIEAVLQLLLKLPHAYFHVPEINPLEWMLYFSIWLALFWFKEKKRIKILIWVLAVFLAGDLAWRFTIDWKEKARFWIEFLDVGHGDSACIHLSGGKVMLIDGGSLGSKGFDIGRSVLLPYLRARGITKIDIMLVTHPHPDHYSGFRSVVRDLPVEQFWFNGDNSSDPSWQQLFSEVRDRKISIEAIGRETLPKGIGAARIIFLHPSADFPKKQNSSGINNRSIALILSAQDKNFFFSGDIEWQAEAKIIDAWQPVAPITLLKVPHHGSLTSSTVAFLRQLDPSLAIVSAGRFGHITFPHPKITERYQRLHIPLLSTKECGAMRVMMLPGGEFEIDPFRKNCEKLTLHPQLGARFGR